MPGRFGVDIAISCKVSCCELLVFVQARGAVLVNLEIAGVLFVTNYRLVFVVRVTFVWF